ncbi:MAG: hypothetical protein AABY22_02490 [Nanoarchaeota archaeon]
MIQKQYKYKTSFASILRCPISEETDKLLAQASLEDLKEFLPKEIDFSKSFTLLPFSCAAFVANIFNKNFDGVAAKEALAIYPQFKFTHLDLEHNFAYKIGIILNVGLAEFTPNYLLSIIGKPITEEEANKPNQLFNVVTAGIIWRVGNDSLIDLLSQANDPNDKSYLSISASFELAFDGYEIYIGKSRNIFECTHVTDENERKKLEPYLKSNGGSGQYNDMFVYRLLTEGLTPIGVALVNRQAAPVKGILVQSNEQKDNDKSSNSSVNNFVGFSELIDNIWKQDNKEKTINSNKISVKEKDMALKLVKTVKEFEGVEPTQLSEIAMAAVDVQAILQQGIKDASEKYIAERDQAKNAFKIANEAKEQLEASARKLESDLKTIQDELKQIKDKALAEEVNKKFQDRMTELTNVYDLADKDRGIITKQIRELNDEQFKAWATDFEVIAEPKKKKPKDDKPKADDGSDKKPEDKKDIANASDSSVKDKVDNAMDKTKEDKDGKVANASIEPGSLKQKYANIFNKETIIIKR